MRSDPVSLDQWQHKPSSTQPLLWNYSSPQYKNWTNECKFSNNYYSGDIIYNSMIYYIIYKNRNDPGIQYNSFWETPNRKGFGGWQ